MAKDSHEEDRKFQVKLSDFGRNFRINFSVCFTLTFLWGMARLLPPENFYENSSNNEKPYKWASVEVLKSNKYSKQSGKFSKNSQKKFLDFSGFFHH